MLAEREQPWTWTEHCLTFREQLGLVEPIQGQTNPAAVCSWPLWQGCAGLLGGGREAVSGHWINFRPRAGHPVAPIATRV